MEQSTNTLENPELTPEQQKIEEGRLSLEEAQEFANMMQTKLNSIDKNVKPTKEDYNEAFKAIEEIQKILADDTVGNKIERISGVTLLLSFTAMISLVGIMAGLAHYQIIEGGSMSFYAPGEDLQGPILWTPIIMQFLTLPVWKISETINERRKIDAEFLKSRLEK